MTTDEIDVVVNKLVILNEAETPQFSIKDEVDAFEDLRLKCRYLDIHPRSYGRLHGRLGYLPLKQNL